MKIGELAARTGLAASAIRFYERSGLLPSAQRGDNRYRVYGEEAAERLRVIALGQALGFSLEAMRSVFASADGFPKEEMMARLQMRLSEIEQLQAVLRAQSKDLRALRDLLLQRWDEDLCVDVASLVEGLDAAKAATVPARPKVKPNRPNRPNRRTAAR